MKWPKDEHIPNESILFCRVHIGMISKKNNLPNPSAFYNTPRTGDNLSTDWDKYSTAEESRDRIGLQYRHGTTEFKNKLKFNIYSFSARKIRSITPEQIPEHDPHQNIPEILGDPNNRSHSIIIGDKGEKNDPEVRLKLVEIGDWAIGPSQF